MTDIATCGNCGLSWDDSIPTGWTPVPSGRCPFEYFHQYDIGQCQQLDPADIPADFVVRPVGPDAPIDVCAGCGQTLLTTPDDPMRSLWCDTCEGGVK